MEIVAFMLSFARIPFDVSCGEFGHKRFNCHSFKKDLSIPLIRNDSVGRLEDVSSILQRSHVLDFGIFFDIMHLDPDVMDCYQSKSDFIQELYSLY